MEQAGQKDVDMAVPEAGGDRQTFAVDHLGVARDFDRAGWADGGDMAVVDEDGGVVDGRVGW